MLAYHGVLNDEGEEVDGAALYGVAQDVHLLAYVPRLQPPVPTSFGTASSRRKITLIESNVKCRYLKKFTCKATLRQVIFCLRPPPLVGFCLWLHWLQS